MTDSIDLIQRGRIAFDRCKEFPEAGKDEAGFYRVKPDAFIGMLDLRNLWPEIEAALRERKK